MADINIEEMIAKADLSDRQDRNELADALRDCGRDDEARYLDAGFLFRAEVAFDGEDATADWYDSYGWHLSSEEEGDILLQAVEIGWLAAEGDGEVAARVAEEYPGLAPDEVASLVEKARSVFEFAVSLTGTLGCAVDAYREGRLEDCMRVLRDAKTGEEEHGDWPLTRQVAGEMLIDALAIEE